MQKCVHKVVKYDQFFSNLVIKTIFVPNIAETITKQIAQNENLTKNVLVGADFINLASFRMC